ncbi:MAG: glycosyltransferase [Isosphaeraceae bacterium]
MMNPSQPSSSDRPGARLDDELAGLRAELRAKHLELCDLREQLRAIHNSDAWAVLRTLGQLRTALAPPGTRRDAMVKATLRSLRRIKKLAVGLAQAPRSMRRALRSAVGLGPKVEPVTRRNYAVICLPMIEWHFRFQRPQQLMRRFARTGHLVLYAANRFHRGTRARVRPVETNVLEILLPGDPTANVYQHDLAPADRDRMAAAVARLADERGLSDAVIVAQHPYWTPLAEALRERFGWPIVYDCMDDHAGFLHNGPGTIESESRLVATADLVVASSGRLHDSLAGRARRSALIRNACEYEHFSGVPSKPPAANGSPTIGYYGAIAEWFDGRLVAELAAIRPGWRFELIGSTLAGDVRALEVYPNVRLLGECPYAELPRRVEGWDAYIIPFRRVPLTEATNPVKVYEMLATGKPVAAVALPELVPIAEAGLIRLAATAEAFAEAIERELREDNDDARRRRREFAARNTWAARQADLAAAIEPLRHLAAGRVDPAGPSAPGNHSAISRTATGATREG